MNHLTKLVWRKSLCNPIQNLPRRGKEVLKVTIRRIQSEIGRVSLDKEPTEKSSAVDDARHESFREKLYEANLIIIDFRASHKGSKVNGRCL
jgi:hypothetical protein